MANSLGNENAASTNIYNRNLPTGELYVSRGNGIPTKILRSHTFEPQNLLQIVQHQTEPLPMYSMMQTTASQIKAFPKTELHGEIRFSETYGNVVRNHKEIRTFGEDRIPLNTMNDVFIDSGEAVSDKPFIRFDASMAGIPAIRLNLRTAIRSDSPKLTHVLAHACELAVNFHPLLFREKKDINGYFQRFRSSGNPWYLAAGYARFAAHLDLEETRRGFQCTEVVQEMVATLFQNQKLTDVLATQMFYGHPVDIVPVILQTQFTLSQAFLVYCLLPNELVWTPEIPASTLVINNYNNCVTHLEGIIPVLARRSEGLDTSIRNAQSYAGGLAELEAIRYDDDVYGILNDPHLTESQRREQIDAVIEKNPELKQHIDEIVMENEV